MKLVSLLIQESFSLVESIPLLLLIVLSKGFFSKLLLVLLITFYLLEYVLVFLQGHKVKSVDQRLEQILVHYSVASANQVL